MNVDVLIRGAEVFPGEGPSRKADVAITAGKIIAVAPSLPVQGAEVIEAEGLMLCPGFIDMHAHSALVTFRDPQLAPKIAQGFTTEVINPDGLAPAPVAPENRHDRRAYLQALEGPGPVEWTWSGMDEYLFTLHNAGAATTLIPSIGHNAVRDFIMGGANRAPTAEELTAMRHQVRAGLEAGARTFSFGLIYLPGAFAGTDELIELAKEAAPFGVPLVPHVRNEGRGVLGAVDEMIEVSRRSGAPLHLSHLKVIGNPDLVEPLLERIDRAAEQIDITFDQYPYGAGSTVLSSLLPAWAQAGGTEGTLQRLRNPGERRTIARDVRQGLPGWENIYSSVGPERIVIVQAPPPRESDIGKTLAQIAEERAEDSLDTALDLLLETGLDVAMIDHYATEETVRTIFRHPKALVGSDGIFGPRPHPRLYGTAARVLGRYALREKLIPLEEAVARLTARAADRLGLRDRGRIIEGLRGDLVLLDPARYIDTATFEEPKQYPEGVERVVVAGKTVWRNGAPTGALPGGVLGRQ
ncbi:MAG: D-aminoacylase [Chloroflexota bacterium]|nr:D-aminoacylase [Chloroflexota bacterium]